MKPTSPTPNKEQRCSVTFRSNSYGGHTALRRMRFFRAARKSMKVMGKGGYDANGVFPEFGRFFRRAPALPRQISAFGERSINRLNRRNRNNIEKIIGYKRRDIRRYGGMISALGFFVGVGALRVPGRRISEKGTAHPSGSKPTPRQISADYLADHHSAQACLGFPHLTASPRKGSVREGAKMTTRRPRSPAGPASPEPAGTARRLATIRVPPEATAPARAAARATRREERAAIARAVATLTAARKETA